MQGPGQSAKASLPPASVIVVSRGRPEALRLCLKALALQDHPQFELVVVACSDGLAAVAGLPFAGHVRSVAFDKANISEARNLGLMAAAGEVCAFIDDDAVAEPTWLSRLVVALGAGGADAAGGYVLGRNGFSLQWGARQVDALGQHRAVPLSEGTPCCAPGFAPRTEGTNMAFRRDTLARLGGFDPAFRFYLDETDLNFRLAAAGARFVIVPEALVHHGVAPGPLRRSDRVPLSLHEIGASMAVYLRRHALVPEHAAALQRLRQEQRQRLLRYMVSGALEPRDVRCLMHSLEAGIAAGMARALVPLAPLPAVEVAFRPLPGTGPRPGRVVAGWSWQRRALTKAATAAAASGAVVTVFRFSPSTLYHHQRFHPDGYWLQTGGIWGRSLRQGALVAPQSFAARVQRETARVAAFRPV